MRKQIGKKLYALVVASGVLLLALPALAWRLKGKDGTAREVLGCYHPTGQYDETDFEPADFLAALAKVGNQRSGRVTIGSSNIYWRGGFTNRRYVTRVRLDFRWEQQDDGLFSYWVRFPVVRDTAPILPDRNCYLRTWVPVTYE